MDCCWKYLNDARVFSVLENKGVELLDESKTLVSSKFNYSCSDYKDSVRTITVSYTSLVF